MLRGIPPEEAARELVSFLLGKTLRAKVVLTPTDIRKGSKAFVLNPKICRFMVAIHVRSTLDNGTMCMSREAFFGQIKKALASDRTALKRLVSKAVSDLEAEGIEIDEERQLDAMTAELEDIAPSGSSASASDCGESSEEEHEEDEDVEGEDKDVEEEDDEDVEEEEDEYECSSRDSEDTE